MLRVKLIQGQKIARKRLYSPTALTNAYRAVMEEGLPVYRASRQYQVPLTTLRDRVDNRVSVDCTRPGPEPVLSQLEEAKLVAHIKELAAVGYGYTRSEILTMATDYAVHLGKRDRNEKCFSMQWFYSFMSRWPELHVVKPSSLSEVRAKCASTESISNYFKELDQILRKHNLKDKPHLIYNIDEKGINTECKPPNVIAAKGYQPQAVMADRSKTVTIIGAGNALGTQIPPFFIFPGQRMVQELMQGKSAGADGTMTTSGWSNSEVFSHYMKNHFLDYVQGRGTTDPLLVLYDGHRSHISIDLVDWAKDNNIVLFVLPPHCSHILQPMDIGCFGPLQLKYSQECLTFNRLNHRTVTRYDVCELACKAYALALSPANLQAAFAKAGIFPFRPAEEMTESLKAKIAPSTLYDDQASEKLVDSSAHTSKEEDEYLLPANKDDSSFFTARSGKVGEKVERKKRRNISTIVGGKAVTEDTTLKKMRDFLSEKPVKPTNTKKTSKTKTSRCQTFMKKSPAHSTVKSLKKLPAPSAAKCLVEKNPAEPGPSCINLVPSESDSSTEEETESQIKEDEKCCVCKRFYVKSANIHKVAIVNWAECESCGHWVHLMYCTHVRVVRRDTPFKCPCC